MMNRSLLLQSFFALIFGAIAVFSYAPFGIWPIAFISFCGLLLLVNQNKTKHAALIAFVWGLGYFSAGVHWVYVSIRQYGNLPTPLAIIILFLLIVYLSLYPMLFATLVNRFKKHCPAYSFKQLVILVPLIWQLTEFFRGTLLNGFAWLQFGYTQLGSPLKGLFPLFGINGVNLIFSICCGILAYVVYQLALCIKNGHAQTDKKIKMHLYCSLCTIMVIFFASYWLKTVNWTQVDSSRQANIALLQGNIQQSLRWNREQLDNTLDIYTMLTQKYMPQSDIIIWPEAAITDLELNQQYYLQLLDQIATENNTAIAVGIIDLQQQQDDYQIYNTLIVLGDEKPYQYPTANRYLKHHLVPFGEYTPLESLLKPLAELLSIPMSSMSPGPEIQPALVMKGFKFSTVICYEVILSDLLLKNFTEDTDFLLTVSNDAWFGDTIGPWQHLQMAQARALEFGRTLLRSTNNGITVIISPQGNIIQKIPQFTVDALSTEVSPSIGLTPYARWGNYLYYAIILLLIVSIFIRRKN